MPHLHWLTREHDLKTATAAPYRLLDEVQTHGDPASGNMLIQGDNLDALKALLPYYAGRVQCIYIDPPYNTKSAFEHYDDNLEHSQWLALMYPRLELLHELLSYDGSIWVSCDDNESHYLKVIMDEIFGRKNFSADISWQRTYATRNDSKGIVSEVEHLLVYSKAEDWSPNRLERTEKMNAKYKNPDNDVMPWTSSDAFAAEAASHQGMVYAVQHPFSGEMLYPYSGSHWRYQQDTMLEIMQGWCPYELRDIDDAEKRAAVCGLPVEKVRQGVMALSVGKFGQYAIIARDTLPEGRILACSNS